MPVACLRLMLAAIVAQLCMAAPAAGEEPLVLPDARWGAFFSSKDQRVPIEPTRWPWYAIGRVNIADSVSHRHCTGTLVGAQLVLTAGHCLFDYRLGHWVKAEHVHFVAGQARDAAFAHARAQELIIPSELDMAGGSDPVHRTLRKDLIAYDWALVRLQTAIGAKPVPVKVLTEPALEQEMATAEIARAGYSADRSYLLSAHRGCAAALSEQLPGVMLNRCDSRPGDSGSPLLLLRGEEASIIALSTGAAHGKRMDAGYTAIAGFGPAAARFAEAVRRALEP